MISKKLKVGLAVTLPLLATVTFALWGPLNTLIEAGKSASTEGKTVTVYSSRHYEVDSKIYKAFTERTGIRVIEVKGTPEELIQRLKREGEQSEADLFLAVDGGVLEDAKQQNVLQPVSSPEIETQVPAHWRDPDHSWFGIAYRARVIVYALDRVDPLHLQTYEDMTSSEWRGRILVRSASNLYNQSMLASFIALDGESKTKAWANGIVRNMAAKPDGGDRDQARAIADKSGDVALMNSYYFGQMLNSDDPEEADAARSLGIIFPNQQSAGTHVNISGIGLTRYADQKEEAIELIGFLTSPEGQTILTQGSYEFPVNEAVEWPDLLKTWGTFKFQSIDFAKLRDLNKQAVRLFKDVGWQ